MSAFKYLRDVSNDFETDLRQLSTELFSVKVGENFEDSIAKKLRKLSLYRSKLRLLRAKPLANNPEVSEHTASERITIQQYEDTATEKVLEQQIVKFLTQSHAVKELLTTPSESLDPELVERKEKILECLTNFSQLESQLKCLELHMQEKNEELDALRRQWDKELELLRDCRDGANDSMEVECGPLHKKLSIVVDKMELMRWLVAKLSTSRSGSYDWLADPQRRVRSLFATRRVLTVEDFLEE